MSEMHTVVIINSALMGRIISVFPEADDPSKLDSFINAAPDMLLTLRTVRQVFLELIDLAGQLSEGEREGWIAIQEIDATIGKVWGDG